MRRRPSPSLVVSIVAVVLALGGTSVAAINYARDAGAVNGHHAVSWKVSTRHAAGKLVTTYGVGPKAGKIPQRFLDLDGYVHGLVKGTFHQSIDVNDNAPGAPVTFSGFPGVGTLSAQCDDQNAKAGVENPQIKVTFANTSGGTENYARTVGSQPPAVEALVNGTQDAFTINNANTFTIQIDVNGTEFVAQGAIRQDGPDTAAGVCTIWGYGLVLEA